MDTPRVRSSDRGSSAPVMSSPELPALRKPVKKRKIGKTSDTPQSSDRGSSAPVISSPERPAVRRPVKKRKVRKTSDREVPETPPHRHQSGRHL
jgi:hypothetical protein